MKYDPNAMKMPNMANNQSGFMQRMRAMPRQGPMANNTAGLQGIMANAQHRQNMGALQPQRPIMNAAAQNMAARQQMGNPMAKPMMPNRQPTANRMDLAQALRGRFGGR